MALTAYTNGMADDPKTATAIPTLEEWQHWTLVMGRAQQMLMEFWADQMMKGQPMPSFGHAWSAPTFYPEQTVAASVLDPAELMSAGAQAWAKGLETWGKVLGGVTTMPAHEHKDRKERKDRRFAAPEWHENPIFDTIRKTYLQISDRLLGTVDDIEGLDMEAREKLRFATQSFVDAMSPSNFALTNPQVLKRTLETRGENLLKGLANMLKDIASGQLTQTKPGVFEVGRNLAMTPGKVIKQTPLYQLIQYTPTTDVVLKTPVVIFPPWINRFYILDLNPEKSFVRWCVANGVSLFMVSWKSADESIADATLDDYVLKGQIDAIDTVRNLLGVESVDAIGYCVAGTTLASTLAYLEANKQAGKIKSATFLTAQVDFTEAGDLKLFTGPETQALLEQLTSEKGYLDGRYMAATFNLLRGRDLIWSYVVNNYLLGEEPAPFDLLYWNSDTTNLPAPWHRDYIESFYKGNKLAHKGEIKIAGTPVDIDTVRTPTYVQAGREDHISPPQSVWKIMNHFAGPVRFVLAGSGHIAGVVNPPAAHKYQYWINDRPCGTLERFIEGAQEHKGSWWPDWLEWLKKQDSRTVKVDGARVPGKGKLKAVEDAPGSYVKAR
jgi:poly[(R)-3-hydroxyalkanoate] polymerase subunit PhaC